MSIHTTATATRTSGAKLFKIQGTGPTAASGTIVNAGGAFDQQLAQSVSGATAWLSTGDASIGGTYVNATNNGRWDIGRGTIATDNVDLAGHTLSLIGTNQISFVATTLQSSSPGGVLMGTSGRAAHLETSTVTVKEPTAASSTTVAPTSWAVSRIPPATTTPVGINWPMTVVGNNVTMGSESGYFSHHRFAHHH